MINTETIYQEVGFPLIYGDLYKVKNSTLAFLRKGSTKTIKISPGENFILLNHELKDGYQLRFEFIYKNSVCGGWLPLKSFKHYIEKI